MNSTQQTCPYRVLEVEPGASRATVEQAYQRLSQIFGPTSLAVYGLVDDAQQRRMLDAIEAAFRTLGDPAARAAYDDTRGHPPPPDAKREAKEDPVAAPPAGAELLVEPILLGDEHIEVVLDGMALTAAAEAGGEAEEPEAAEAGPLPSAPAEPLAAAAASIRLEFTPAAARKEDESPAATRESSSQAVEAQPPLPPMPALEPDTTYTGDLLRAIREARGLSLQQIAARTRITTTHLGNIELERWDWLPERVFLRGFLISFARELKLDPAKVSETYLARRDGSR